MFVIIVGLKRNENFQIINLVIGLEGLEFLFNGELSFLNKVF